jgi:hypothetical protein
MAKLAKIGDLVESVTPAVGMGKSGIIRDVYKGFCDGKPRYSVEFDSGVEMVTREKFRARGEA